VLELLSSLSGPPAFLFGLLVLFWRLRDSQPAYRAEPLGNATEGESVEGHHKMKERTVFDSMRPLGAGHVLLRPADSACLCGSSTRVFPRQDARPRKADRLTPADL